QYDELAHHFGPSSKLALSDLRRTDARIKEIWRMIRATSSRPYDLVILSDHGMTPAASYRVKFGESLGTTVKRILRGDPVRVGGRTLNVMASASEDSEYADVPAQLVETVTQLSTQPHTSFRRRLRRFRNWVRSRYGLRELILPEKYSVASRDDVVVTYSSCLALAYFADTPEQLGYDEIMNDPRRAHLYAALRAHPGIGLVATRRGGTVHLESRVGCAEIVGETLEVLWGENPLAVYGTEPHVVRAVRDLVRQPNAGDLVLFGAYDGHDIISFDDQVGGHGSAGGDQTYPFLITPPELDVSHETIEDARDIHRVVMMPYARPRPISEPAPTD
ncbi:MAG TPA: alkaline phosphatase family protein, partial [Gemmatimonadaceae bacterium]|nr:alkaline phosphatase family protein [Gemmatimonadaceae bacterium]